MRRSIAEVEMGIALTNTDEIILPTTVKIADGTDENSANDREEKREMAVLRHLMGHDIPDIHAEQKQSDDGESRYDHS